MPPIEDRPLRLLISFAPADRDLKDRLVEHLQVLVRFAGIELCEADRIRPGDDWRREADRALDRADVALVLISADFLASDLVQDVEIPKLFQRREQAGLTVIPVLLRSCLWQPHPWLGVLKPLPTSGAPVASFEGERRNRVLTEVAVEIAERAGALPPRGAAARHPSDAGAFSQFTGATSEALRFDTKLDHTAAAAMALGTSPQATGTLNVPGLTINNPGTVILAGAATPQMASAQQAPPITAARPTPSYPDGETRLLSAKLAAAQARKQRLQQHRIDTSEVTREILDLKRRLREGGQLKPGDSLGDARYLLLEEVGRGGFATVWRAHDAKTEEEVAIKVLHSNLAGDRVRLERFKRGARIMGELEHESVVRILDPYGEDGGWHYFVMEYLNGGDFHSEVLSGNGGIKNTLSLILAISRAVALAHQRKIVHRDIKPSNILMGNRVGAPKLTDFDLVGVAGSTGGTRAGGALGSVMYAAPELLSRPDEADAAADVYALGMTTIFGILGQDLSMEHWRHPEELVRRLDCSVQMKHVLERATSWASPRRRYPHAGAFRDALIESMRERQPIVVTSRATSPRLSNEQVAVLEWIRQTWAIPVADLSRANQDTDFAVSDGSWTAWYRVATVTEGADVRAILMDGIARATLVMAEAPYDLFEILLIAKGDWRYLGQVARVVDSTIGLRALLQITVRVGCLAGTTFVSYHQWEAKGVHEQRWRGAVAAPPVPSSSPAASIYLLYGNDDRPFATRLYEALVAAGVPVFFRDDRRRLPRKNIRDYEHVILISSERSLSTPSVVKDLEELLLPQPHNGASDRVIKIVLDEFYHQGWNPRDNQLRCDVIMAKPVSLVGAEREPTRFDEAVQELVALLKG